MNKRAQRGISIVEIMVALTIGLFLTAGVIQLFVSSKQAYRAQEGFARLQENGRYALDVMARALRGHGNLGCIAMAGLDDGDVFEEVTEGGSTKTHWGRLNVLAKDLEDADDVLPNVDALMGVGVPMGYQEDATDGDTRKLVLPNPEGGGVAWAADTDALVIVGVYERGTYLGADMTAWDGDLVLADNNQEFNTGDLLLITDCANVDIFQVSGVADDGGTVMHDRDVAGGAGNHSDQLSTLYRRNSAAFINAMVYPFTFRSYFIGTPDGGATRSLFVRSMGSPTRELVENVDDLVLRFYGHDDDNDGAPDGYERAVDVTDWDEVRNVEIQLLLRSPETVLLEERDYDFDDTDYENDRFLRHVFATTVAFRPRSEWRVQ